MSTDVAPRASAIAIAAPLLLALFLASLLSLAGVEGRRAESTSNSNPNLLDQSKRPTVSAALRRDETDEQDDSHDAATPDNINDDGRSLAIKPRIVGGGPAASGQYPYIATLYQAGTGSLCAGTLIAPDLILTAGHCAEYIRVADVGRYDLTDGSEPSEIFVMRRRVIHPDYTGGNAANYDVALLQLQGTSSLPVVRINSDPNVPSETGEALVVAGWGDTDPDNNESESDILLDAEVAYVDNAACKSSSGTDSTGSSGSYQNYVKSQMMCASGVGKDACAGDSGGPLIQQGPDVESAEDDLQVGVVSWGFGCAEPNFPGVYARISSMYEWIEKKVCALSEAPPDSFGCGGGGNGGPPDTVDVVVQLRLDSKAFETGWRIESESGETVGYAAIGSLANNNDGTIVSTTVALQPDQTYKFFVLDAGGTGFCCAPDGQGWYKVFLSTDTGGEGAMLVSSNAVFGYSKQWEFSVPMPTDAPSRKATEKPTTSFSPSRSPTDAPTAFPTRAPTDVPTNVPSPSPSDRPSSMPSNRPTTSPSTAPSNSPSNVASSVPSNAPSETMSMAPSAVPSSTSSSLPSTTKPTSFPLFNEGCENQEGDFLNQGGNLRPCSWLNTGERRRANCGTDGYPLTELGWACPRICRSLYDCVTRSPIQYPSTSNPTAVPTAFTVQTLPPSRAPQSASPTATPTGQPIGMPNPTGIPTDAPTVSPTRQPVGSISTSPPTLAPIPTSGNENDTDTPTAAPTTSPTKVPIAASSEPPVSLKAPSVTPAPITSPPNQLNDIIFETSGATQRDASCCWKLVAITGTFLLGFLLSPFC